MEKAAAGANSAGRVISFLVSAGPGIFPGLIQHHASDGEARANSAVPVKFRWDRERGPYPPLASFIAREGYGTRDSDGIMSPSGAGGRAPKGIQKAVFQKYFLSHGPLFSYTFPDRPSY